MTQLNPASALGFAAPLLWPADAVAYAVSVASMAVSAMVKRKILAVIMIMQEISECQRTTHEKEERGMFEGKRLIDLAARVGASRGRKYTPMHAAR